MADLGSKEALKAAIDARIFTNTTFETSSEDIRSSFEDTIDTLGAENIVYEPVTYNELVTLIGAGDLVPGSFYEVPYECIHRIVGTTDLNTASAQYVQEIETFLVQALSVDTISPWVHSRNYPGDSILWDLTNNLAEDGSTARPGKVLFREDKQNDLSAFYDFRAVLFRVGATAGTTTWTTGQNWTRGQIVNNGSDFIFRAVKDQTADTDAPGAVRKWAPASPGLASEKWVWDDNASYLGNTINRTAVEDKKTFISCSSCHIGPTTQNDEYNAIILDGCTNVSIPEGSYNGYIKSSTNIGITGRLTNSVIYNCNYTNLSQVVDSYLENSLQFTAESLFRDIASNVQSSSIKSSDNSIYQQAGFSQFGYFMEDSSFYNVSKSIIGNDVDSSIYEDFIESSIGNDSQNNTLINIVSCNFGHNVTGFDIDATGGLFQFSEINNNCTNFDISGSCQVNKVDFAAFCNGITMSAASRISDTKIGASASTWTLGGGSIIEKSYIGSDANGWVLDNGGSIRRSSISEDCNNFSVDTGGTIEDSEFGPGCTATVNTSGRIRHTLFGAACTGIVVSGNSLVDKSWFGEFLSTMSVLNGSSILRSNVDHQVTGITVDNGGEIIATHILSGNASITVDNSGLIEGSTILQDCQNLTVDAVDLVRSKVGPNLENKTFKSTDLNVSEFANITTAVNDTAVETFGEGAAPESVISPDALKYKAISFGTPTVINLNSEDSKIFSIQSAADTDIDFIALPSNKELSFVLENTDASAHDFLFGNNLPVGYQLTVNIAATTTALVRVMRVTQGSIDKIILLSNTTL